MKKDKKAGAAHTTSGNTTTISQGVLRDSSKKRIVNAEQFILHIPQNIYLDDLLNKYPIDIANAKDYIVFLLHQIHAVSAFRNNVDIEESNGYTNLSGTILQDKVDNYAPLLAWCIDVGIIESDYHYSQEKGKSIGYRFSEAYRTELKEQVITLRTLIKKIKSRKKPSKLNPPVLMPENIFNFQLAELAGRRLSYAELARERLNHLERWFNKELKVDMISAEKYLIELRDKEEANPEVKFPMHNFNCRMLVLEALNSSDKHRFKVDEKAGRLHTNLTSTQSELKAFIKYQDKKIVSADIINCQPMLSLNFLNETLLYKNKMLERIALYNKKFDDSISANHHFSYCSMLGNFIRENSNAKDVLLYKGLVLSGGIYEYFGNILQENNIASTLNKTDLRKFAKKQIFRAFFDRNTAINRKNSHALKLFRQHFPTVYEIFSQIKSGKHNALACALQNLESEIVLHRACLKLWQINPEIPLWTIHDSIASTEENYELVKDVLKKVLFEVVEVDVEIKREPWDETLLFKKDSCQEPVITKHVPKYKENKEYGLYGYADMNDLLKPYSYSMKKVGNLFGIGSITLNRGLRQLGVFAYNEKNENIPSAEYLECEYFIISETEVRFNTIKSPKATKEGIEFIGQLIKQHPALFPLKKRASPKMSKRRGHY